MNDPRGGQKKSWQGGKVKPARTPQKRIGNNFRLWRPFCALRTNYYDRALDRILDSFDGVDNGGIQRVEHIALTNDRRSASIDHGFFVFTWTACGQRNDGDERVVHFDQC